MKKKFVILFSLIFLLGCQTEFRKVENIVTFAKAYGYVKYFHPSDEASSIDWNKFSIHGCSEIEKCKTNKALVKTLTDIFSPIASSVSFSTSKNEFDLEFLENIPEETSNFRLTYWQHKGVSIGMDMKNQPYESRRINRNNKQPLFNYQPKFGESIVKEIGDGVYCHVPLVLYCNKDFTYPQSEEKLLSRLEKSLVRVNNKVVGNKYLRLGNIVNVYNVFQHFYPYFDVVDADWEGELRKALIQSYSDKTKNEHLVTMEKMTAPLKDGHINVWNDSIDKYYAPPIAWEWINNKLIITHIYGSVNQIYFGDEVTEIEGQIPEVYFQKIYSTISAGTHSYLHYRANIKSLQGKKKSSIQLIVDGKKINLKRCCDPYKEAHNFNKIEYKELEDGIWYLNLDRIKMDTIRTLFPKLEESKAIICDLRGYPNNNHDLIKHLLPINDTTKAWMQVPQIVYPDQENIIGFNNYNWMEFMKSEKPYLGDKNVIFIINGQVISYAESFLAYIEGYDLATIVGQTTAGTNGNVNPFSLPGGYHISWTGMKVVKHDGSQHHGIGIIPHVNVEKTIEAIRDGRDEFLEKALEIAKK